MSTIVLNPSRSGVYPVVHARPSKVHVSYRSWSARMAVTGHALLHREAAPFTVTALNMRATVAGKAGGI